MRKYAPLFINYSKSSGPLPAQGIQSIPAKSGRIPCAGRGPEKNIPLQNTVYFDCSRGIFHTLGIILLTAVVMGMFFSSTAFAQVGGNDWYNTGWMNGIFSILEKTRVEYGVKAVALITPEITKLTIAFLGLWLLWQAGSLLMPFGPQGRVGAILNTTVQRVMLTIVVLAFVGNFSFYTKFYDAIGSAGVKATSFYIETAMKKYDKGFIADDCSKTATITAESNDKERGQYIQCLTLIMQKAMGTGYKIGLNAVNDYMNNQWTVMVFSGNATAIMQAVAGFPLLFFYGFAMIQIPFRMLNTLCSLVLATILSPALMAAYIFPFSRKFAINGLKLLIHSAVTFMMMGVVISLMIGMLAWVAASNNQSLTTLSNYILQNGIADGVFWNMLLIGIVSNGMMLQTPTLATYAVNLPMFLQFPPIATKLFDTAANGAKGLGGMMLGGIFNKGWQQRKQNIGKLRSALRRRPTPPAAPPPARRDV
jgi:hypothetical protein